MVSNKLTGRVAVITASTEGIGLAIAKRYLQEGAKVVISSRTQAKVKNALQELRALEGVSPDNVEGIVCHVNDAKHRKDLVLFTLDKYEKIDILVLNAGINPMKDLRISKATEAVWDVILKTNLVSAAMLINEVYPHMKKNLYGKIIVISSVSAYNTVLGLGPYSISKTALLQMTRLYAGEFASSNIFVNCIAPGMVTTKMTAQVKGNMLKQAMQMIPLNKFAVPFDITGTAVLLACEDSDYITGETISINGGIMSRL